MRLCYGLVLAAIACGIGAVGVLSAPVTPSGPAARSVTACGTALERSVGFDRLLGADRPWTGATKRFVSREVWEQIVDCRNARARHQALGYTLAGGGTLLALLAFSECRGAKRTRRREGG
ncbi:hypothetical protein [Amycolatopsis aidingensis]|uniref:hypothetical protein n=1 Tax=Amycolatopsis aidingensis TaxID=2842453 RepID=UPI001C0C41FF|nr:hypothetical protein [Amycolatopsis aidingensis]